MVTIGVLWGPRGKKTGWPLGLLYDPHVTPHAISCRVASIEKHSRTYRLDVMTEQDGQRVTLSTHKVTSKLKKGVWEADEPNEIIFEVIP